MMNFISNQVKTFDQGSAFIIHTFDILESEILENLSQSQMLPEIYTIGPLHLLENQIPEHDPVMSVKSSLWKEESDCIEWLHTKMPNSVIYVDFGSITVMTAGQLKEFALGLANSNINFLWIIRPDLVSGESAILGPEFIEGYEKKRAFSKLVSSRTSSKTSIRWRVFDTLWMEFYFRKHIFWCANVVLATLFAEQQTNSWYCTKHLGISMETISTDPNKDEVEKFINELMVGEKGQKKMREKAKLAEEAITAPSGSSYKQFGEIDQQCFVTQQ